MSKTLDRRTFLRAGGVCLALPMLDAMRPTMAASAGKPAAPRRFAAFYVPNGVNWDHYTPKGVGADWELPRSLKGLEPVKRHVSFLSGLAHPPLGTPHFGGDNFLTGASFHISNYRNTISLDQRLAESFGRHTRLPSLELTGDHAQSLRYGFMTTLAWSRAGTPVLAENSPRRVFERLFVDENADDVEKAKLRLQRDRSILDRLTAQSRSLSAELGAADRAKLDEYLTSVEAVEKRIRRAEEWAHVPKAKLKAEDIDLDINPDTRLDAYVKTMMDLMVLAFQTDTTRVATYVIAREGGGNGSANYKAIGVTKDHHQLSHENKNEKSRDDLREIDTFHVNQLSYFLQRLAALKEDDGTVLDNSAVVFGSGLSVGWNHDARNLPVIIAGGAGGKLKQGRHLDHRGKDTPFSNVFLSMLYAFGFEDPRFGASTGTISELLT